MTEAGTAWRGGAMGMAGRVGVAVAMGVIALLPAGCGRRGGLEPPPAPRLAAPEAPADPGLAAIRRPKHAPIVAPDQPFVLDPLL